jgi:hypothetical protein
MRSLWIAFAAAVLPATTLFAAPSVSVSIDPAVRSTPATGRLVVYLSRVQLGGAMFRAPANGFNEESPQPIYGIDVKELAPGAVVTIDDSATSFPVKLSELPPGQYRAQAVLDMSRANSSWQREPGNLFSENVAFDASRPARLVLKSVVREQTWPRLPQVEVFQLRSKLLSDFHKREVMLRAGVAFPVGHDRTRRYAAVYEVPGFGGDHTMAFYTAQRRSARASRDDSGGVSRHTFWIFLDPESPNGHTLLADSDNNGPVGQALVTELIPALEAKFNLIAEPTARIVTGHSSGGWSSLWLATRYPETFGACWSSSPDPIDFRKFEMVDIYASENLYKDAKGEEVPAARFHGVNTMSTRQENGMEHVLGPRNDSAQQWDSWQAVFGHRGQDGNPKPLFDPVSGAIDRTEAESYRRYDIGHLLNSDPKRYAPIFRERVRLVCGEEDNYFLEQAVKLVKADLDRLDPPTPSDPRPGYIKLVPGADHSSVYSSPVMQAWSREMLEHLRKHGHVRD